MNDQTHMDDPAVAAVLAAAACPAEGPVPGEAAALAAFRTVYHPHRRLRMPAFSEKAKLIAAAVFGGVVVISDAAGAATGSLPLVSHGHSHPAPATTHAPDGTDDDQGDVQDSTDTSTSTTDSTDTADTADSTNNSDNANNDHGSLVSSTAHNAPQGHKGPAVCVVASDNKCKAGQQHGQSDATTHGQAGANTNATTHRQNTPPPCMARPASTPTPPPTGKTPPPCTARQTCRTARLRRTADASAAPRPRVEGRGARLPAPRLPAAR